MSEYPRQIVLIGLSGVGKSAVGRVLAERLGWPLLDTDDLVTAREGVPPAAIITDRGEPAFRRIEEQVVAEAATRIPAVISTGGGAFQSPANRRALGTSGLICFLDATPAEIARRIEAAPDAPERPLLGDDLPARLEELDRERRAAYLQADVWVPAQGLTEAQAAERILHAWAQGGESRGPARLDRLGGETLPAAPQAMVDTGRARYPVWIAPGELAALPERLRRVGRDRGRVFLVSDANVAALHGPTVAEALDAAGIPGASYVVPAGEASKSPAVAAELHRWLAAERAERGDTVIALGGGVVGDLAGYAAATYLRGMPLVQVPTSLLGMTDAAIGGKVAIDLPAGKNLVGAFHQPAAVVCDIRALQTLPRRAYLEGFGEVVKHAFAFDPGLLATLTREAGSLTAGLHDEALVTAVVQRSAWLKALIVSGDETERGLRAVLNYGHTIGHGIEAAAGYEHYLHGEAVAVGMMGAARIAARLGLADEELVAQQADVLRAFHLPLTAPGVDPARVWEAMRLDKKVTAGRLRFVLLERFGRPVVRDDVPEELVREVLHELTRG